MTVKIDGVEPNIFPHVHDLDARDAGRDVDVFFDVKIEGKPTVVTVKLSYEQASDLATLPRAVPKAVPRPRSRSAFRRMMIAVRRSPTPPVWPHPRSYQQAPVGNFVLIALHSRCAKLISRSLMET
jgi:hypothetical protein